MNQKTINKLIRESSKLKHTPGPWSFCSPVVSRFDFPSGVQVETKIATVEWNKDTTANLRLIRAAPELLEVLREIVRPYDAKEVEAAPPIARAVALLNDLDTRLPY